MARKTNIEWTETTWNPTTGCTKISEGCKNCYAEKWAIMQQKRGIAQYTSGFRFRLAPERIHEPLRWKTGKLVFVNSMSDLFHEEMPHDYLIKIFSVMNKTPQHTYQILTKRIERATKISNVVNWPDNVWLGVSVENNKSLFRIDILKETPARFKFVSFEPLLEQIDTVCLLGINWVIVGGESGGRARKIEKKWVSNIQRECKNLHIPFFFKQWGKKEFNPDINDPTIEKSHIHYAKGGCLIDRQLHRNFPFSAMSRYGVTC